MSKYAQKATKTQARLRLALIGPSGAGKTYSALAIASGLGERIVIIDTEHGTASKYAGDPFTFDTVDLADVARDTGEPKFSPRNYVAAIKDVQGDCDVLIIDSLSHAWEGEGGALDQVDQNAARYKGNKFAAWRDVTPQHRLLVEAILGAPVHVIGTMRSKTAYELVEEGGKKTPIKIGLAPIQRDGVEYEFDVVGDIDHEHRLAITKTRCAILDNKVIQKPGAELAATLKEWLSDGVALADAKDIAKLDKTLDALAALDASADWRALAEKAAGRPFAQLSKPQMEQLQSRLDDYVAKQKKAATVVAAEPQEAEGVAA